MPDRLDRAEEEIEMELAEALRVRKPVGPEARVISVGPIARGICYYCLELIDPGLRWCPGTSCEREWEYEWQRKRANGE